MTMQQIVPPQNVQPVLRRSSTSPSSEPSRVSTVSAASAGKVAPKKNQYPCPMAKQIGCTDFFTTSGHAARHAKKHTGKKDAFCPECNKAFTRKDNMEQHRRTHQNGRGASRSSTSDDSKVKKATKQATKKNSLKAEPQQLEAAVEQQLAEQAQAAQSQHTADVIQAQLAQAIQLPPVDHNLLLPAVGPYFLSTGVDSGPVPALPMAMPDLTARPPLHRSTFTDNLGYIAPAAPMIDPESLHYSYPSPGLSNGLNSLALAASETQRLNEKPGRSARSPASETSCSDTTP